MATKKLLISIPGTTGPGDVMRSFDSVAALIGYHAISLDYPNNRNTASLINSTDKEVFNKFRQELDFGTPVSDSVNVDSANSIVNRITKLVIYLAKTRPTEGWNNFLDGGRIIWERVTLAGHSQGAGHVSYIAHAFRVHKVIMLSGPQDFLANFNIRLHGYLRLQKHPTAVIIHSCMIVMLIIRKGKLAMILPPCIQLHPSFIAFKIWMPFRNKREYWFLISQLKIQLHKMPVCKTICQPLCLRIVKFGSGC